MRLVWQFMLFVWTEQRFSLGLTLGWLLGIAWVLTVLKVVLWWLQG